MSTYRNTGAESPFSVNLGTDRAPEERRRTAAHNGFKRKASQVQGVQGIQAGIRQVRGTGK
ncbi:MAG TPA: hypothetical protein VIX11_01985, partial [Candidatus Acidoferrum sp.]